MDITDTKVDPPYSEDTRSKEQPVFNPSVSAAQWNQQKLTRSTVDTTEDNIAATIDANPI